MKKHLRMLSLLLALCAALGALSAASPRASAAVIWDGTAAFGFASGDGSEASPYMIETPRQLAHLAARVNGGTSFAGKHIALANDLTLNSLTSAQRWEEAPPANSWTAIGTLSHPFSGVFDGRGHTVSGVYISTQSPYQGLFGCVSGGTVKNTGVASSYISGGSYVGGIAGRLYADKATGGAATVAGCYNSGTVCGSAYVGGVVGLNYAYLSGSRASVSSCFNSGEVKGSSYNVGGVVGRNMANPAAADSSAFAHVTDCYSSGGVSGLDYVGGIAGQSSASAYSTASVATCYSAGAISGGEKTGGIVGQNHAAALGTAAVKNSFYLEGTASAGATSSGGGGRELLDSASSRSPSALGTASSLTGFDFDNVWTFGGVKDYAYPTLRAISSPHTGQTDEWQNPFADVPEDAPYRDAVKAVVTSGLMDGTGPSTFSPFIGVTRGMVVTILWRMSGKPAAASAHGFTDVAQGAYYEAAIAWGAEHKVISGYGDGTFRPDTAVSRQELAVIIYNYASFLGINVTGGADLTAYSDGALVAPWAAQAVRWNVKSGIVTGTSATELSPASPANRAQAAIIITRFAALAAS